MAQIAQKMLRHKADVRISIRGRNGKTHRIELRELLTGEWQVFVNRRPSRKMPCATSTQIADHLRRWLKAQRKYS